MFKNNKFCLDKAVFQGRIFSTLFVVLLLLFVSACSDDVEESAEAGASQKAGDGTTLYLKLLKNNSLVRNVDQSETVSVVATLKTADDKAIEGEVIQFTTDLGTLAAENGLTNSSGRASVDLASGTVPKAGEITASVDFNGNTITVSYGFAIGGTAGNADPDPGSSPDPDAAVSQSNDGAMEFISASPQQITLKSAGGAGLSELSTVTFKLVGADGLPLANKTVNFTLNNPIGGISVEPTSAVTGFDGLVSTVVQAGTVPTSARVTATTTIIDGAVENTIFSQSDNLAIGVGTPDQNSMSLSISNHAPEAWRYDGEEVDVTVHLADHFNNFIPDGTTVYFTAEGGLIEPSCETIDSACSVIWKSGNPRPSDHRVTILATTLGSESFQDTDSDGIYSSADGEPFSDVNRNGVYDEPFDDANGNGKYDEPFIDVFNIGVYDLGEIFIDYNNNGIYDGDGVTAPGEDQTAFTDSNNGNGLYDGSGRMPAGEFPFLHATSDKNSNGLFDGPGFADLGEPYLDANENNTRDVDEHYVDTNDNNEFDAAGDGLFNGVHCKTAEVVCSPVKTLRIRDSGVLVMADSFAHAAIQASLDGVTYYTYRSDIPSLSSIPYFPVNSPETFINAQDSSASIVVYYMDSAGQVLPEGTTVSISANKGSLVGAPNGELPNNLVSRLDRGSSVSNSERANNGLHAFSFSIVDTDPLNVEDGVISISFKTLKGTTTTFTVDVRL